MWRGTWSVKRGDCVRVERFWDKVQKSDGCWEWQGGYISTGYGCVVLTGDPSIPYRMLTHRAAWMLTYGEIPDGLWVLHKCDNRRCVRPDHLFLGTRYDNIADCKAKGRVAKGPTSGAVLHPEKIQRGEEHHHHKLTEAQVLEIRRQFHTGGISKCALSRKYGVTPSAIRNIIKGTLWAHLPLGGTA